MIKNKIIEIKSSIIACKQQKELLRKMRLKNKILEEIIDVYKQLKQVVMLDSVTILKQNSNQLEENEEETNKKIALLLEKYDEICSLFDTNKT